MSRIGNKIITLPEGVKVDVATGNLVTVTGPKGTLTKKFYEKLTIEVNENTLKISRPDDEKSTKQQEYIKSKKLVIYQFFILPFFFLIDLHSLQPYLLKTLFLLLYCLFQM